MCYWESALEQCVLRGRISSRAGCVGGGAPCESNRVCNARNRPPHPGKKVAKCVFSNYVSQIRAAKVGRTIGPLGKKTVVPGERVGRGSGVPTPRIWVTEEGRLQHPPLPQCKSSRHTALTHFCQMSQLRGRTVPVSLCQGTYRIQL